MLSRSLIGALGLVALAALAPAPARGQDPVDCRDEPPNQAPAPRPATTPIMFGIYSGGAAGQIGGGLVRNDPLIRRDREEVAAALRDLSGGRPFVVHLYNHFTATPDEDEKELDNDAAEIAAYAELGYDIDLAVRYAPATEGGDVPGYLEHVRRLVRRFAGNPRFVALQVTNEANFPVPGTSDGGFAGVREALIEGVIAADEEARRAGRSNLHVGFNWIYRTATTSETEFWTYLGVRGGQRFLNALDWVGIDAYPNTFFPPSGADFRESMVDAMRLVRECFMPLANIPASVPIHFSENGWPTGPGRSEEQQLEAATAMLGAVRDFRGNYNVTDYRWFTLRDADSDSPNLQEQFGILRDDYSPKPAFGEFKRFVGELSPPAVPPRATPTTRLKLRVTNRRGRRARPRRCIRPPARVTVIGRGHRRIRRVDFTIGRKGPMPDRRAPFRRRILRPAGTNAAATHRIRARIHLVDGRALTLVRRIRLCARRR